MKKMVIFILMGSLLGVNTCTNVVINAEEKGIDVMTEYALSVMPCYIYANSIVMENEYMSDCFAVYDVDNNEIDHYIYFLLNEDIAIGLLSVYDDGDEFNSSFSLLDGTNIDEGSFLQLYLNEDGLFAREGEEDFFLCGQDYSGKEDGLLAIPAIELESSYQITLSGMSRANASYSIPVSYVANATTSSGKGLCWAACIASRVNYESGLTLTAKRIYSDANRATAAGKPSGLPEGTTSWMEYTYNLYGISATSTDALTMERLVKLIESDTPVIFNVFRTEGGETYGHAVLMKAYYILSSSSCVYMFMDPNISSSVSVVVSATAQTNPAEFVYNNGFHEYDNWSSSVY